MAIGVTAVVTMVSKLRAMWVSERRVSTAVSLTKWVRGMPMAVLVVMTAPCFRRG
ncbi:hypothetical protein [Gryllotalpicola koreensis]|uniref:hypothetical protein n=1 Tax=Gryllotalpicola koreensis TaxID=993086 RepID=UPI003CD05595